MADLSYTDALPPALVAVIDWHRALLTGDERRGRQRSLLRRARSLEEVRVNAGLAFYDLERAVRSAAPEVRPLGLWLPTIAALLPEISLLCDGGPCDRDHRGSEPALPYVWSSCERSLARQAARPAPGGSRARLSDLRFRRLLAHETLGDAFTDDLRRAVRLVRGEVCLWCLARDLRHWRPDAAVRIQTARSHDHPRVDWSRDYYSAVLTLPTD